MTKQANQGNCKHWTIKSMPVAHRKLAINRAAKQGMTVAEWMTQAVTNLVNLEDGKGGNPSLTLTDSRDRLIENVFQSNSGKLVGNTSLSVKSKSLSGALEVEVAMVLRS